MSDREALESMVWQFGYRSVVEGRRCISCGGLGALEDAFDALGWSDPHYTDEGGCEVAGCAQWADCVGAYPRSLVRPDVASDRVGFGFVCGDHFRRWNGPRAESAPDLGRRVPLGSGQDHSREATG